jgi:serine O-acetyltransferase
MNTQAPPMIAKETAADRRMRLAFLRERRGKRPGILRALRDDAFVFATMRGERNDGSSRAGAIARAVRLVFVSDAYLGLAMYRLRTALQALHVPVLPWLLHRACMAFFQICIGNPVIVKAGVYLPHGQVVIDGLVEIGSGVVLCPWVTIGRTEGSVLGPTLEDNVLVGTGAKILGPVTVGANAKVAANAVVVHDVPPNTTVAGAPAQVVAERHDAAASG